MRYGRFGRLQVLTFIYWEKRLKFDRWKVFFGIWPQTCRKGIYYAHCKAQVIRVFFFPYQKILHPLETTPTYPSSHPHSSVESVSRQSQFPFMGKKAICEICREMSKPQGPRNLLVWECSPCQDQCPCCMVFKVLKDERLVEEPCFDGSLSPRSSPVDVYI